MARPPSIRDEEIISAARAVFRERGMSATTAEVAERANVSEGSIFKRFRSKVDLFEAAMAPLIEEPWVLRKIEEATEATAPTTADVRAQLVELGLETVAWFEATVPLMMLAFSNPDANGLPRLLCREKPAPVRVLGAYREFFRRRMETGALRRHEPEVVARAFVGTMHQFVVFELFSKVAPAHEPLKFQANGASPADAQTDASSARLFVGSVVDLLLDGIAPEPR